MLIFLAVFYALPNLIVYGLGTWLVMVLLRHWRIGQRLGPARFRLLALGITVVLSAAVGSLYLWDCARVAWRQAHEAGYRGHGKARLPERVAVLAANQRCGRLCDELLARGLVDSVDMIGRESGGAWRYQRVSDAGVCLEAAGSFDPEYSRKEHATFVFPYYRHGLAYNLCLSAEKIAQSDAPVTVRDIDYDFRDPAIDSAGHGYFSRVMEFRRIEVWVNEGVAGRRLLASSEGASVQIPYVPLVFTFPFQSHGVGIDGYGGKAAHTAAYEAASLWMVFGQAFDVPLTGEVEPSTDGMDIVLGNLATPGRMRAAAAVALYRLVVPQSDRPGMAPEPGWLDAVMAAALDPDLDTPSRKGLFDVLAAYGPAAAAAAAAPVIWQAFDDPNGDILAAAINAASAIGLFTSNDRPWLTSMTHHQWWRTNKAALAALKKLDGRD